MNVNESKRVRNDTKGIDLRSIYFAKMIKKKS